MNRVWEIFKKSPKYVNFEDVQDYIKNRTNKPLFVNTLLPNEQDCLISTTILCSEEENLINNILLTGMNQKIVVYGKNDVDPTVDKKYQQLVSLGFSEVYIYRGGLFEWLLLQDIYGGKEFPTTSKTLDLLKYRVRRINI
jgi:hypothetical protein